MKNETNKQIERTKAHDKTFKINLKTENIKILVINSILIQQVIWYL